MREGGVIAGFYGKCIGPGVQNPVMRVYSSDKHSSLCSYACSISGVL